MNTNPVEHFRIYYLLLSPQFRLFNCDLITYSHHTPLVRRTRPIITFALLSGRRICGGEFFHVARYEYTKPSKSNVKAFNFGHFYFTVLRRSPSFPPYLFDIVSWPFRVNFHLPKYASRYYIHVVFITYRFSSFSNCINNSTNVKRTIIFSRIYIYIYIHPISDVKYLKKTPMFD